LEKVVKYYGVLVDLVRFELTTSSMPWKRAPNCATGPYVFNISRRSVNMVSMELE
jgi:hypothetical protein